MRRASARRRVIALVGIAAASFATLAAWLGSLTPPRVTHAEAMDMALAIERASDLADLEELVDADALPSLPDAALEQLSWRGIGGLIMNCKGHGTYACVGTRVDATGARSLMFRWESDLFLLDYHEFRLTRVNREVRVSDMWTMRSGWLSAFARECAALKVTTRERQQLRSLLVSRAGRDAGRVKEVQERLPQRLRDSTLVGLQRIESLDPDDAASVRSVIAEFRAAHPESLAPDQWVQIHAGRRAVSRSDVLLAIARIRERVHDDAFLDMLERREER